MEKVLTNAPFARSVKHDKRVAILPKKCAKSVAKFNKAGTIE